MLGNLSSIVLEYTVLVDRQKQTANDLLPKPPNAVVKNSKRSENRFTAQSEKRFTVFLFSYRFFLSLSVDEVGRTWLATCS
jgi:hypothetical protein